MTMNGAGHISSNDAMKSRSCQGSKVLSSGSILDSLSRFLSEQGFSKQRTCSVPSNSN